MSGRAARRSRAITAAMLRMGEVLGLPAKLCRRSRLDRAWNSPRWSSARRDLYLLRERDAEFRRAMEPHLQRIAAAILEVVTG